jgi:protein-tyrosine-phosphatase
VCTFNEITNLGEVIDPYGQDLSVYMQTMEMLSKGCDIIIEKLIEIGEE